MFNQRVILTSHSLTNWQVQSNSNHDYWAIRNEYTSFFSLSYPLVLYFCSASPLLARTLSLLSGSVSFLSALLLPWNTHMHLIHSSFNSSFPLKCQILTVSDSLSLSASSVCSLFYLAFSLSSFSSNDSFPHVIHFLLFWIPPQLNWQYLHHESSLNHNIMTSSFLIPWFDCLWFIFMISKIMKFNYD